MITDSEFIFDIEAKYRQHVAQAIGRLQKEREEAERVFESQPAMNLDKEVKNLRKSVKLTQMELASRCGVGLRFLRELEQGKHTLRLDRILTVLTFFGRSFGIKKSTGETQFNLTRVYPATFTKALKLKIKQKFNFTCFECNKKQVNKTEKFDIHHIDYNKKNCQESNLVFLCGSCHGKTNKDREYWIKHFEESLYASK